MDTTDSIELIKLLLLVVVLVVCSATDLRARRIPNSILSVVLMTTFLVVGFGSGVSGLLDSVGGLVIGICMLLPLHVLGRMGAGDVKLMGVVGSILGVWGAVVAGLATMMAGAIIGVVYLTWLVVQPGLFARLAPFLKTSAGTNPSSAAVPASGARAAEIPYALAIAAGACAALLYLDLLPEVTLA